MTDKWTEGPWKIDGLAVLGADNRIVCMLGDPAQYPGDLSSDFPNKDANGHLIAAAPDMAKALEQAAAYIGMCAGSDPDALVYLNRVRDAMDKARGETQ